MPFSLPLCTSEQHIYESFLKQKVRTSVSSSGTSQGSSYFQFQTHSYHQHPVHFNVGKNIWIPWVFISQKILKDECFHFWSINLLLIRILGVEHECYLKKKIIWFLRSLWEAENTLWDQFVGKARPNIIWLHVQIIPHLVCLSGVSWALNICLVLGLFIHSTGLDITNRERRLTNCWWTATLYLWWNWARVSLKLKIPRISQMCGVVCHVCAKKRVL